MWKASHLRGVFNSISTIRSYNRLNFLFNAEIEWVEEFELSIMLLTSLLHCLSKFHLNLQNNSLLVHGFLQETKQKSHVITRT